MDIPEQKYKKKIFTFRPLLTNVISEYPIPFETPIEPLRNLKYIVDKEKYSAVLPYTFHDQYVQQIHSLLSSKEVETRMLALRVSRCLPFICRLKIIEDNENEFNNMILPKNLSLKRNDTSNEFHYETVADLCELLLSVYELTCYSEDIYFDVNQKITSIISRTLENCFSPDKSVARDSYEALRLIFMAFGYVTKKEQLPPNKVIRKVLLIFEKQPNYTLETQSASNASSLRLLILKTRQYEIRVRCRMLTGICYLITYLPEPNHELYELLFNQLFIMIENANEFDINFQCFLGIRALLSIEKLKFDVRNRIMKKWVELISQLTYKKQYFQFYIKIIQEAAKCPLRLQYFISTSYLEITSGIQQQFSRFIIYKFACRNIMTIASSDRQATTNKDISHNIIINMFHYSWFIDRINQQGDLFRSQFLICLLHAFFFNHGKSREQEIHDLLSLCNRLLDWKCSSKEQTHIPTIKFAFDLYIQFLKEAANKLGNKIQNYIIELIDRCNEENIYFLFKYKLIAAIAGLQCYKTSIIPYSQTKLNLNLLEGEIRPFMMPKNHKPIFDYQYSLSPDGQIQSRKQIQAIKVIMTLLSSVQQVHQDFQETINSIILDYHSYLGQLQTHRSSNKDLINCLQSLQADNYFSECQRSFLLALIDSQDTKGNNTQYTIDNTIIYSPFETYDCDEEVNAFGIMSPVQLKIKILGGKNYSSVFIQIKKHQWVGTPQMKLVISSALQTKELPFQSGIVEMNIDRIGLLNFQAWTVDQPSLLLGSGSYRVKRKFKWLKVNHLSVIDGIRSKAFFKQESQGKPQDSSYLAYCYGEPILIQTIESKSEIVVTVTSKEIWQEMQEIVVEMVEELTQKIAEIIE